MIMTENELIPKKRPLMGLLVAGEENKESVLAGFKTITIREGWRDYHTGDKVLIGCHLLNWATLAKVTSVNFYVLKDIPLKDLQDDGFPTLEDALLSLSAYYQNINEDSPVTVIRWKLIEE